MDFIIYGAGYRGKRLYNYIKNENVIGFIDSDKEKQGAKCCGKPIFSLEEYKEKYFSSYIIITPAYSDDIESMMQKNDIYQYSNLSEMPSEFYGYGECSFENCYRKLKEDFEDYFCIYGLNAFSFLIYDFLYQNSKIAIFPGKKCITEKLEWVRKYYPEIKLKKNLNIQKNEVILVSEMGNIEGNCYENIVNLFDYASDNKAYWNKNILKFKKIFKNKKRCFIVATGPSLRIEDLQALTANKEFCFGVNNIIQIEKEWIPDVYVVADSNFIKNNMKKIEKYDCKLKFIGDSCEEYWIRDHDDSYKIHITASGLGLDFSEEVCQKIYGGCEGKGTVTYVCLQLAVYMGFTEIYLLGVDCNYIKGSKCNHFIVDDVKDEKDHREDLMIQAYAFAKKYATFHGINIYNATRGGMLEVFERVDFDSIMKDKI